MSKVRAETYIEFELERSAHYRKAVEVLAFRSRDSFTFRKSWGVQILPPGSWIVVPERAGVPTGDVYGCNPEVFSKTYREASSGRANAFEKHSAVRAYQPGIAFAVRTVVGSVVEVDLELGTSSDWLVRNPGGELYVVTDETFRVTYRLINED
jgi:hypothetical protein